MVFDPKHVEVHIKNDSGRNGDNNTDSNFYRIVMYISIFLVFSAILLSFPADAQFDIVRPDKESWVCVDYTVSFCRDHPEWSPVSISSNPRFLGSSHMVACKIENNKITIHDEMCNVDYCIYGWADDQHSYYHFWDGDIKRNYKYLLDNRYTKV